MFKEALEDWVLGYLSECTPEHNNYPRCPYAKKALLDNKVRIDEAESQDEFWNMLEWYLDNWDDDTCEAVVINLSWLFNPNDRIRICDLCTSYYSSKGDWIFIEEQQLLNGKIYHMILVHRFSTMAVAKRQLRKKGYYQDNA